MRTVLNTVLLLLAFAVGQAGAADLTAAQAQQLLGAAQLAKPGGEGSQVTLTIDGKQVVFNVTRDAVGNIIARPVPSPEADGVGIAQASIGSTTASSGTLVPNTLVQVNKDQSVVTYNLTLNNDGTIANLYRPGQTVVANATPTTGTATTDPVTGAGNGGGGAASFTLTIVLPAGTSPGQSRPPSQSAP